MRLTDLRGLDIGMFAQLGESLASRAEGFVEARTGFAKATSLGGWAGSAADAARTSFRGVADGLRQDEARIAPVLALTREMHAGFAQLQGKLKNLDQQAAALGGALDDSGNVRFTRPTKVDNARLAQIRAVESEAKSLIVEADRLDERAGQVLAQAQDVPAAAAKTAALVAPAAAPALPEPPANGTATENAAWWNGLNPAQQQDVIANHPDWIGNRDGVSAVARDAANRALEPGYRAALQAQATQLQQEISGSFLGGALEFDKKNQLSGVQQKLRDLDAVDQTLKDHPNALLMLLDTTSSSKQALGAISIGNPDTADHISATTIGVGTTLESSLAPRANAAQALQDDTQAILEKAGQGKDSVATIAWLGYETPQWADVASYATDTLAHTGADKLAGFYEGLGAAWHPADGDTRTAPQITAFGHSYGSLTTAFAMEQVPKGVVSDVLFYGSPGIELTNNDNAGTLNVQPGHVYDEHAADDPIGVVPGLLPVYGPDPASLSWITRLATTEGAGPGDGVQHDADHGHSDYYATGANGYLTMGGYNMAAIASGHPELAVEGP
ncbi:MAG: alpha/beta hydrolase [Segniliparus sp.]|uniref:alpha/beta hydrolase n=1 Tax=Segniliparus sp. TaxID=2804064 RepID=UPI003F2B4A57